MAAHAWLNTARAQGLPQLVRPAAAREPADVHIRVRTMNIDSIGGGAAAIRDIAAAQATPARDNPRYEHVKMRGPTPVGIYRLSMREKRFYGVEAIRMTSIDGRDPKNRTGLLTHTNLLRGQKGSHGCVAFQNYQPFLSAF